MKVRAAWCRHCDRLRQFREGEHVRRTRQGKWVFPYLECRTCARKRRDPRHPPHVKLTQTEFAWSER